MHDKYEIRTFKHESVSKISVLKSELRHGGEAVSKNKPIQNSESNLANKYL